MKSRRTFIKTSAAALAALHFPARVAGAVADDDALRAKLAGDPLRPQFHLLPAKNWMNDPNGPIFWRGKYHMFFQYNPNSAVWGDMHWNHAVSGDMIHWKHLPIALAPTSGWDDADGCFTGSAVVDADGTATILYTGVKSVAADRATLRDGHHNFRETQCLATSKDPMLLSWEKYKMPVIEPRQDPNLTGFRDPFLFRLPPAASEFAGGPWYCGVASGQFKRGGRVLLYESHNLREWKYLHPLAEGEWTGHEHSDPVGSGEMWECPDFFPLGKKWVLLYSTAGNVFWEVGDLDPKELVFHSQKRGVLDHGAYYAQKTQFDAHGNRILWGWITEKRPEAEFLSAGWAGCMSLPRKLSLSADNDLEMVVAPEVRSLRHQVFEIPNELSASDRSSRAGDFEIKNVCGEFFWMSDAQKSHFALADQSGPWLVVSLDTGPDGPKLGINDRTIKIPPTTRPLREFSLFLDASVAELICDREHAVTIRIYRKPNGSLKISSATSVANLFQLSAWQLRPISTDRLTTPA
ncbi:MAG: glycoside hydrolase family 32 protein [Candidatus Acidiferrum sp.]